MPVKFIALILTILTLSACVAQPPQSKGVLINPAKPLSCKQLEEKIITLEEVPKTESYTPSNNNSIHFTFKNKYTNQLKALKRKAAKQGCYDRPAYIEPILRPTPQNLRSQPQLIDTQRQQLSFDQCFDKCKSLTKRSNEQCFDSCK